MHESHYNWSDETLYVEDDSDYLTLLKVTFWKKVACEVAPLIHLVFRMNRKLKVLIGRVSEDKTESVSIITKSFINGLSEEIDFIPLKSARKNPNRAGGAFTVSNLFFFFLELMDWLRLLYTRSPDIAHYPITSYWNLEKSFTFLLLAKLFKVKTIGHLHGGAFLDFWRSLSPVRKKWALYGLKCLDALVVLSPGWKENIQNYVGLAENRIWVVTNPVDAQLESEGIKYHYSPKSHLIFCLGVMGRAKGLYEILEAAKFLDKTHLNMRFLLCGPERQPNIYRDINRYIEKHRLKNVEVIKGGIWGRQKIDYFKSCFAVLLPSYIENFSAVVLEAASFGIPLIITPVGASPEFFEHGKSALFVKQNDPRGIVEKISFLKNNPDIAVKLGKEAKKVYLGQLSRRVAMDSLKRVYLNIYNNGSA